MSIFYQTQDGWYAGELVEDYDDCMLVEVKIAKGIPVVGCQYSLVKKPNTVCSGQKRGGLIPREASPSGAQMSVGATPAPAFPLKLTVRHYANPPMSQHLRR